MRGRVLAAFVLGFAIGALSIGFGLWSAGTLQTAYTPPWKRPEAPQSVPTPAVGDTESSAKLPATTVPSLDAAPAAEGSADRTADLAGKLRLAMPISGIDPAKLTGQFDDARSGHKHEAIDIMAARGTPVLAVAEGNIVKLFTSKAGGLTIYEFDDTQQYAFYYAHLDRYAPNLKEGMLVRQGDTLGFVGTTGDAPKDAPHLHFTVFRLGPEKQWWKGTAIDPLPLLR